ncbi:MAG: DUF1828 domain-containing protein [Mitsuokella sp.]|uniref:DUF1828 domain-containing protein n=1 Tax=Mitsuokella sp. TaxID=2049034 RepID=UPI003F05F3C7
MLETAIKEALQKATGHLLTVDFFRSGSSPKSAIISTPFLDRHFDGIHFYLEEEEDGSYLFHDDGYYLSDYTDEKALYYRNKLNFMFCAEVDKKSRRIQMRCDADDFDETIRTYLTMLVFIATQA